MALVNKIQLLANNEIKFNKLLVNNYLIKHDSVKSAHTIKKASTIITYFFSEGEELELNFWVDKNAHPEIKMYETSHDLLSNPLLNVQQRPAEMTALPFYINDAVVLIQTIKF